MGIVIMQGHTPDGFYMGKDGVIYSKRTGYFVNNDATETLIRYITRTRAEEDRADELLFWGTRGASCKDVQSAIGQFIFVQNKCREYTKRKMYHLTYSPDQFEKQYLDGNPGLLEGIAMRQSEVLFSQGFQVCYAAHVDSEKGVHIHYAVNSVNYYTGKMLNYTMRFNGMLNAVMTEISYRAISEYLGKVHPIACVYNEYNPVQL